jgi:adenosylcobinamide-GDP ribazoletransferase
VDGLRFALAFLTRLPGGAHPADSAELARAVPWFPVVGLVVGLATAAVYVPLAALVPPLTAAAIAVGFAALITGAFHEDGVADSFDALAGGRDVEGRLQVLKDPRHGTFGVLALVVVTLVKVTALGSLGGEVAAAALVGAATLGRTGVVGVMAFAPLAAGGGLGASYARSIDTHQVLLALGGGVVIGSLALGPGILPALALVALGGALVAAWAVRRIGGITGDLLGAAEQVGECAVLVLLAGVAPAALWFW